MKDAVRECISNSIECKKNILNNNEMIDSIGVVCQKIVDMYKSGRCMYICGNGGSAADAQHFAAELVGRFILEREALPAVALTTDSSIVTSIGNDYGYENVFKRQVEAMIKEGDILFVISTSGNSNNLTLALEEARKKGAVTIGLLGKTGGQCKELCDYPLVVNYDKTPNIQESHIMIIHTICKIVEEILYEK